MPSELDVAPSLPQIDHFQLYQSCERQSTLIGLLNYVILSLTLNVKAQYSKFVFKYSPHMRSNMIENIQMQKLKLLGRNICQFLGLGMRVLHMLFEFSINFCSHHIYIEALLF